MKGDLSLRIQVLKTCNMSEACMAVGEGEGGFSCRRSKQPLENGEDTPEDHDVQGSSGDTKGGSARVQSPKY